jgi:hypothetical protein
MSTTAVAAAHTASIGVLVGTFTGLLPPLAALFAIIWYIIEIYQSVPVQKAIANWRARHVKKQPSPPGGPTAV